MAGTPATENLSASYARWRSTQLGQITDALEQRLLLEMLAPIAGETVLDVGCGDGLLALELARRGAIVTGLDADATMIAAARRAGAMMVTPTRFIVGQAEKLPFDDNVFGRVVAVTVLCFVREAANAVAEMARVLRPGGRLVIGELGCWSWWAAQRRIRGRLGHPIWRNAKFRTAREIRDLAQAAGLAAVEIRGAVHYPPWAPAARLFAPIDLWMGRHTTLGSAFVVVAATKPLRTAAEGNR